MAANGGPGMRLQERRSRQEWIVDGITCKPVAASSRSNKRRSAALWSLTDRSVIPVRVMPLRIVYFEAWKGILVFKPKTTSRSRLVFGKEGGPWPSVRSR
jgi:hypothetical protein